MAENTPIPSQPNLKVSISSDIPKSIPSDAKFIPNTHFAMIFADSAATMLMPVPFIGTAIESEIKTQKSNSYEQHYASIDIMQHAKKALSQSNFYTSTPSSMQLYPIAYIQECIDDVFRITLAFHLESKTKTKTKTWQGRYLYHVPFKIPADDIEKPTEEELSILTNEIEKGFSILTGLIERDITDSLKSTNQLVDFGSLYIYGSRLGGIASPYMMHLPDGQLIEEGQDYVIFRHSGDMTVAGTAGALLFGVHYFKKDQLHTLEISTENTPTQTTN